MLVSVIMPCFNSEATIRASVNSVIAQKYENWELLICDDGSTDGSMRSLTEYQDSRIRVLCNKYEKGAAGARNTCLDEAAGDFYAFLDSDDIWSEDKLQCQIRHMGNSEADLIYGSYYTFNQFHEHHIGHFMPKKSITMRGLLTSCDIGCLTVMIRAKSAPAFRFPQMPKEDYAAWIECLKRGLVFERYSGTHAFYRLSDHSSSSNKPAELMKQYKVLRDVGGLGLFGASFYLACYMAKGIFKHHFAYKRIRQN